MEQVLSTKYQYVSLQAREAEPTDEEIACHLSTEKQDNLMGIFSNIDSNQPNPRSDTSQRHQEATGRLTPVRHTTKEITPENVDNSIATDQFLEHFLGNGDSAISKVARSPGFPCQTTIAASPSSDILEDLLDLTAVDKQSTTLDIRYGMVSRHLSIHCLRHKLHRPLILDSEGQLILAKAPGARLTKLWLLTISLNCIEINRGLLVNDDFILHSLLGKLTISLIARP